jgi:hypothetical protein
MGKPLLLGWRKRTAVVWLGRRLLRGSPPARVPAGGMPGYWGRPKSAHVRGALHLLARKIPLDPPPPSQSPFPRPSPQGTPEALPSPILQRLSSTSQSHAAPCAAWRRGVPAGLPRSAGRAGVSTARALGAPGGALPRTQKVLWHSYPLLWHSYPLNDSCRYWSICLSDYFFLLGTFYISQFCLML